MFDLGAFEEALAELTFNSKPIINTLTTIAHENIKYHHEVVKAIEARILNAKPNEKLCSLYLLDSIVKNIGLDYTSEFSHNLVDTFCRAYETIQDEYLRGQYLKLLKTWYLCFPHDKVKQIEARISSNKNPNEFQKSIATSDIINEINSTLQEKGKDVFKKPQVVEQLNQLSKVLAPQMMTNVPSSPTSLLKSLSQHGLITQSVDPAVQDLYSKPFQCKTCAARFDKEGDYKKHLDKHAATNKLKNCVLSRKWYQSVDDWIQNSEENSFEAPSTLFSEAKEEISEEQEVFVLADDSHPYCPICKEKFEKVFRNGEFYFRGAVFDPRSGIVTHKGCVFEENPTKKKKFE